MAYLTLSSKYYSLNLSKKYYSLKIDGYVPLPMPSAPFTQGPVNTSNWRTKYSQNIKDQQLY